MPAVLRLVAHEFRARWRGWMAIVLLVAVAGGAVLAAAAGARRTNSAYPRFLRASRASDVLVSPAGSGLGGYYSALARLPGVAAVAPVVGLSVAPAGVHGLPSMTAVTGAPLDGRFARLLDVPKLLAGRLPRAGRPAEIALDQNSAATLHVHVGSILPMVALARGPGGPGRRPAMRHLTERVVGIFVTRASIDPVTDLDKIPFVLASTALIRELGPRYLAFDGAYVKLNPGRTPGGFSPTAQALTHRFPATRGQVFVADESTQAATIERAIRPEAVALGLFTLVFAITVLLIVGQAVSRLLVAGASEHPTLAALGMTRRQLMTAGLIEVAVAAAAGAVGAVVVAVSASPLMPIGAARLAEPHPGVSADLTVFSVGTLAIVILLTARAAWPAWRLCAAGSADARPGGSGHPSRLVTWLADAGAPLTVTTGVWLALEPGRGRVSVPVRSALAGTVLSVLAVTAAFTFGTNLLHLVRTPSLYGQSWDAAIDLQFGTITPQQAGRLVGSASGVSGWTLGDHGIVGIDGVLVPAIGLAPGRGPLLSPTLLAGHPPRSAQQIVLGASTLRRIGRHVGQSVTVSVNGHRLTELIVGRAVFPNFGQGSFTPTDLGQGAETTAALLRPQADASGAAPGFQFVLVRFAGGPHHAAYIAGFRRAMAGFCQTVQQTTCVETDQRPNGVTNYARIDGTPEVLAGLLAVLGLAVLGQLIVVSGRRRRHDFAIMKALGRCGARLAPSPPGRSRP